MKPAKLDTAIAPAAWREAERIASGYTLVIERDPDVGYLGRTAEFPLVMADGDTVESCAAAVQEATALAVAEMLERGARPPTPASAGRREEQLNVRLSSAEKLRLEQAATRGGFRSVSDFVRFAALREA